MEESQVISCTQVGNKFSKNTCASRGMHCRPNVHFVVER